MVHVSGYILMLLATSHIDGRELAIRALSGKGYMRFQP